MKLVKSFDPNYPFAFALTDLERTEVKYVNADIFADWCNTVIGEDNYLADDRTVLIANTDAALKFKLRWELEEVPAE